MSQQPQTAADLAGPLSRIKAITEDDMLLDYAYVELLEPNRFYTKRDELAAEVERVGGLAKLTPELRRTMIDGIKLTREPMLGFLLRNSTSWFQGSLDVNHLASVRLTSWFEQPKYANARTVEELLLSPSASDYVRRDFQVDAMRGRPIAVASDLAGPYCLVEGTGRCCSLLTLHQQGALLRDTIEIIVGVCPNIDHYTPFMGGALVQGAKPWWVPIVDFLKGVLLTFSNRTHEGQLVEAVGSAFRRILRLLASNPDEVMHMDPRRFEEFVAGCYDRDGFTVTLTRRSGDFGRDVIAEKAGVGTIRVLDQVKRYKPGRVVTAEEVRAFLYVAGADKATKCFITTTSDFAPRLLDDPFVSPPIKSGFLELRPRERTIAWLRELDRKHC